MSEFAGIYIHVPFCASRCHYCNFATGGFETGLAARYVAALKQEILRADVTDIREPVDTIYFGGGTPTTLSPPQLSELLEACRSKFVTERDTEVTIEANPGSVSKEYLEELREDGFNRLSFGVQSFDDRELQMIDRTHTADEARQTVRDARDAGFGNVSVDLIAGLPEQSRQTWLSNIESALALQPEHISVYILELYKDAPLSHRIKRGELVAVSEEDTVRMYYDLVDAAKAGGYSQYEISNWSRPGFESRHNLKYWKGQPYWAFGVSAAGYDGRRRWSNTRNINEYLSMIDEGVSPIVENESLSDDVRQSERIFLGLRMDLGVDTGLHQARYGVDIRRRYAAEITRLEEAGLLEFEGDIMRISRKGKILANEVFAVFV